MSEFNFYEELKASLEDAIAYKQGDHSRCRVLLPEVPVPDYKAADIVRARKGLNLSQRSLANLIGVSPRTVEGWETGKNEPAGPACRLLRLLETDHSMVERIITQ